MNMKYLIEALVNNEAFFVVFLLVLVIVLFLLVVYQSYSVSRMKSRYRIWKVCCWRIFRR